MRCWKWRRRTTSSLIEDDYESENNFSGAPHPALKSLDTADRVIYVGSLSKTLRAGAAARLCGRHRAN